MPVSVVDKVCIQPGIVLNSCVFQFLLLLIFFSRIFFSFVIMGKAIVIRLEAVCRDAYMI